MDSEEEDEDFSSFVVLVVVAKVRLIKVFEREDREREDVCLELDTILLINREFIGKIDNDNESTTDEEEEERDGIDEAIPHNDDEEGKEEGSPVVLLLLVLPVEDGKRIPREKEEDNGSNPCLNSKDLGSIREEYILILLIYRSYGMNNLKKNFYARRRGNTFFLF